MERGLDLLVRFLGAGATKVPLVLEENTTMQQCAKRVESMVAFLRESELAQRSPIKYSATTNGSSIMVMKTDPRQKYNPTGGYCIFYFKERRFESETKKSFSEEVLQ